MGGGNCLYGLETHTRKNFLRVPDFQPPRIANCLESGLEATHKPSPHLSRLKPRNRLAHTLGTRELEQRAFLSRAYQEAFIDVQGCVT